MKLQLSLRQTKKFFGVFSFFFVFAAMLFSTSYFIQEKPSSHITSSHAAGTPSPLIWGDNLTMNPTAAGDTVVNSPTVQAAMKAAHVRMLRMPYRSSFAAGDLQKGFQAIQNIGAVPNLILNGETCSCDVLGTDTALMNAAITFFGNQLIYFDFGNEESFGGGAYVTNATSGWNTIIPKMKAIMAQHGITKYQFGGPISILLTATSTGDVTNFWSLSNPKPDYIDWHEYACANTDTPTTCLDHTDTLAGHNYLAHIQAARTALAAVGGGSVPLMFNEWDYAPQTNASNSANATFMTDYTTRALTLWANASVQYNVIATAHYPTDGKDLLVTSSGALTPQGAAFKAAYEKFEGTGGGILPTTNPTTNPTTVTQTTSIPTSTPIKTSTPTSTPVKTGTSTPTPTVKTTVNPTVNGTTPTSSGSSGSGNANSSGSSSSSGGSSTSSSSGNSSTGTNTSTSAGSNTSLSSNTSGTSTSTSTTTTPITGNVITNPPTQTSSSLSLSGVSQSNPLQTILIIAGTIVLILGAGAAIYFTRKD